jgi:hypothetical protein
MTDDEIREARMATTPSKVGILSVTVRYRTSDGREGELSVGPEYDALFFSAEAADRFLLPYYLACFGFEKVDEIRRRIAREYELMRVVIPRHKKICSIFLSLNPEDPAIFEPPQGSS